MAGPGPLWYPYPYYWPRVNRRARPAAPGLRSGPLGHQPPRSPPGNHCERPRRGTEPARPRSALGGWTADRPGSRLHRRRRDRPNGSPVAGADQARERERTRPRTSPAFMHPLVAERALSSAALFTNRVDRVRDFHPAASFVPRSGEQDDGSRVSWSACSTKPSSQRSSVGGHLGPKHSPGCHARPARL
jgi:hypothetical protein